MIQRFFLGSDWFSTEPERDFVSFAEFGLSSAVAAFFATSREVVAFRSV